MTDTTVFVSGNSKICDGTDNGIFFFLNSIQLYIQYVRRFK